MNEIKTQTNFLSVEECEWFIRFFEGNRTRVERENEGPQAYQVLDLYEHYRSYEVKYLLGQLIRFCPIPNSFVEYFQVVKRTEGNELPEHIDFDDTAYSGVVYLNDDFEEGGTFIGSKSEQTVIQPERGKILGFPGSQLSHGVLPTTKGVRYVITCWWKTNEWVVEDVIAASKRRHQLLDRPLFQESGRKNPDFPYAD
jgi:prolyl 4-hydroxylase